MALVLNHATKAQLADRFRARFRDATRLEVWRMASFIRKLIDDGDVTVLQVRTAFGLNSTQFNALASKFDAYRTKYYELKAAAGE